MPYSVDTGDNADLKINTAETKKGFPSHLVDQKIKKSYKWCFHYVKAMHWEYRGGTGPALFRNVANKYKEYRDYARGNQEVDQYKEMLGAARKRNRGKRNLSWKNLDWSILPIAPKFVEVLKGKMKAQPRNLKIRAIDSSSLEQERLYESELAEWIFNREWYRKLADRLPGFEKQSPVQDGEPEPKSVGDIPMYKNLFYKDEASMELTDVIELSFEVNNMPHIREEVIEDLIEVGIAGTRTYIDSNGFLKTRRVVPERMVANQCKFKDFRDLIRVGEYVEMTISDLKQMAGNQFTEDEYRKIAEYSTNKTFGAGAFTTDYYEETYTYPYDYEKITVLDAEWLSVDEKTTNVSKDRYGNLQSEFVGKDFLPKGVSDDDYKEKYNGERYIIRRNVKNRYRAMWVVDSPYLFNYGLATDMPRQASSLAETSTSYKIYTTNFDSLMRKIIPVLDQIQINWLQFQNHVARSRPAGLSIEMSALENLSLGKGGERMTPKEALRLYFDTGILLWRRKEWSGHTSQWKPVEELNNGIGDAAAQHFQNIINQIDILRNLIGLNQVDDASTPNPEIGKFVTETASQATNFALDYLYHAEKEIYEGTAQITALLLPDLIKRGGGKGMVQALGKKTFNFFKNNIDLTFHEFSIKIEAGSTDEQKIMIHEYTKLAMGNDKIEEEHAIMISQELNPYKQVELLRHFKEEKTKRSMDEQKAVAQIEEQKNVNSANAAADAEIRKTVEVSKIELQKEIMIKKLDIQSEMMKGQVQLVIAKIKSGTELTKIEKKIEADIIIADMKVDGTIEVAEIQAESAENVAEKQPKSLPPKK